jgi:aldehyde dehydrogenase (NAD+)
VKPQVAGEALIKMVNSNKSPGFSIESSPFGGIKDSGLGIKEVSLRR